MPVTGVKKHADRLKKMTKVDGLVLQALYAGGQEIEIYAEHSITEGSISGKGHVASLPGQPPKADTRLLDTSIETTVESKVPPKVNVTSNAPYSAALEYGTSKMEERPFMRPAVAAKRDEVVRNVAKAVRRANRA